MWCWRRLLRVPWTARRSNQSILKEINPAYSLEGLMPKLKLQYLGHLMQRLTGKDPDAGKEWGQEKGVTEDEMVGCHHWLNEYEFELTLGDSKGQGSLVCCSPWRSQRVKHNLATEQQQWLKKHIISLMNLSPSYKRLTTVPQGQVSSVLLDVGCPSLGTEI